MEKIDSLRTLLKSYSSVAVAFSGGVDSTFLAHVAQEVLGDKVLLITATSSTYPTFELEEATRLAQEMHARHHVISSEELEIPGFSDNPPNRCYYCKKELFTKIKALALQQGISVVCEGSTLDDLSDYRPGRRAIEEEGIRSPLMEVQLTKKEIRELSKARNLSTASKPSFACLASRFPYGEKITSDALTIIDKAEIALRLMGYTQFRVRYHGTCARVELCATEIDRGWAQREDIFKACKEAGFVYCALDTKGYRTGAMNEMLP